MSETAATDAAVAAPVADPSAQPTPEATEAAQQSRQPQGTPEDSKPKSRADVRANVIRKAKGRFEKPEAAPASAAEEPDAEGGAAGEAPVKTSESGTHHRKDGTFASKEEVEAAASDDAAHAEEAEPERAGPPEGFVRIEVPEGHEWRRAGGQPHYDVPAASEQFFRTALNNATRRSDVERLETALQEAEKRNIELAARTELARQGLLRDPENDPALQGFLEDVKAKYPELYEQVKTGLKNGPEALVHDRVRQGMSEYEQTRKAQTFVSTLESPQVRQKYGVWSDAEFRQALAKHLPTYGDECDRRGVTPDLNEFLQRLDVRYVHDPRVVQQIETHREQQERQRREALRAEVRAELEAEQAKKAAGEEVQDRHRTVRGVGRLAAAGRKNADPAIPTLSADEQLDSLPPSERRQALRQRARARAAGRF